MSFKDCVNTKDCEKMQTDIDDVKNSISGISDDVDTINETTIPAIEDEIAGLDDRVTNIENESDDMKDWELYTGTDWSQFSTDGKANQEIILKITATANVITPYSTTYTTPISEYRKIRKGDLFSQTGIVDSNYHFISYFSTTATSSGTSYRYIGLISGEFEIGTNSSILTGNTVSITVKAGYLGKQSTGTGTSNISGTETIANSTSADKSLTKNGTGTTKIELYYRPTE